MAVVQMEPARIWKTLADTKHLMSRVVGLDLLLSFNRAEPICPKSGGMQWGRLAFGRCLHAYSRTEALMAGGFTKDGAVQDQIDASVADEVNRARSRPGIGK